MAQNSVSDHHATFAVTDNSAGFSLMMSGYLDGNNTFTYPNTRAFQPMKKLRISNVGTTLVERPRLLINNKRNWFDIHSIREECFAGATSNEDRALAVWKFVRDNRLHYYEPALGREIDDPVKFFGVYGFGMCYNTSFVTASLAAGFPSTGLPYAEYSPRNRHSVKDVKFENQFFLLDSDLEVFYRKLDNKSIASYKDLASDKYLISRVHHYGKAFAYNSLNDFISNAIYEPVPTGRYAGLYREYHTLDFNLRPGETLEYNWEPGEYYHHNYGSGSNARPEDIGNGKLIYEPDFANTDLSELVSSVDGFQVYGDDTATPGFWAQQSQPGHVILKVTSPFVIVNGQIDGRLMKGNTDDLLELSFSKDSVNWRTVWSSDAVGSQEIDVNLYDFIQPIGTAATYRYFIKVEGQSGDASQPTGIESLQIVTHFQVSKFFLPTLELGNNTITYNDKSADKPNVKIEVEWIESSDNTVPSAPSVPIFPTDGATINGSKFEFSWAAVSDSDGITDYEFQLSDRPDLKYPLSPSFELFTSRVTEEGDLNSFPVSHDGMLSPHTTYYWRVRAKDGKGVWSAWSPIWSFDVNAPIAPHLKPVEVTDTNIEISWIPAEGGSAIAYSLIYGSNEANGFTPQRESLIDSTSETSKVLPFTDHELFAFYRIVAVDKNGKKSGASNYVRTPYPNIQQPRIEIIPGQPTNAKVTPLKRFKTDGFVVNDTYVNLHIYDSISINIAHKPAWMSVDNSGLNLYGTPTYLQAHASDSIVLELTSRFTYQRVEHKIKYDVAPNRSPELSLIDTVVMTGSNYSQILQVIDQDLPLGDEIKSINVLAKPKWVDVTIDPNSNTALFSGKASLEHIGDTIIVVEAVDLLDSATRRTYHLSVIPNTPPAIALQDSVALIGSLFESAFVSTDADAEFGDYVTDIKILDGPLWIVPETLSDDFLAIHGRPTSSDFGRSFVTVVAEDAFGGKTTAVFSVRAEFDILRRNGELVTLAPNPFTQKTSIIYFVEEASRVDIKIIKTNGELVQHFNQRLNDSGKHTVPWDASTYNDGIYVVIVTIVDSSGKVSVDTRKVIKTGT